MKGLRGYVIGFGLSLALTYVSYSLVQLHLNTGHESPSDQALLVSLAVLAITQLAVQCWFFLHLGDESRPRWNLTVFAFMLVVVTLLVGGSLWIMKHLNYHNIGSEQSEQYIIQDEGYGERKGGHSEDPHGH